MIMDNWRKCPACGGCTDEDNIEKMHGTCECGQEIWVVEEEVIEDENL